MLKSTYKPSAAVAAATAPLQPGWTEHKAPSGHTYYYNAATKQSTYKRPVIETVAAPVEPAAPVYPSLATPAAANAFMAQVNPQHFQQPKHQAPKNQRPKPQPIDKPRSQEVIPGHEGWYLVYTKYNRRFVYNSVKDASYWRIPEKFNSAILEMDRARIRAKAGIDKPKVSEETGQEAATAAEPEAEDSEYEEVEVTDDEDAQDYDDDEHDAKRQRTEEPEDNGPVEFTEEDIMMQLQAMGDDYDYNDEENEEPLLSEEDAQALFWDMLDDFKISPFSPWEKLLEDGKIIEDSRYTVLETTKARKECWDAWTRERIRQQKEQRASKEKADPRAAYVSFLGDHASPKLFWPEFKRKFRKEPCMTDHALADKEREKLYRELVKRMKMAAGTLKSELMTLLKAQPVGVLNRDTDQANLPAQVRYDLTYVSMAPAVRDPLVEAYIQTLPPAPAGKTSGDEAEDEVKRKAAEARQRREKALADSERRADEEKRRQRWAIEQGKARLREQEEELAAAMDVGRRVRVGAESADPTRD